MKFQFSLEKLLRHKRTVEDSARRDWLEAKAEVDRANDQLQAMYRQIDESRNLAANIEASGGPRAAELAGIDEFINGHKIRIQRHREKLRELVAEAERRHEILVEAARERKSLEKLKERRYEEYRAKRKKLELKRVDELVVTRFKNAAG